jgi:hypothetical protein
MVVCSELFSGFAPVYRPFTHPKIARATIVIPAET